MTKRKKIIVYIFLVIVSAISIFPLVWMIIASTNRSNDILAGTLTPGRYLVTNYRGLQEKINVWRGMWNSFRNAFLQTFLSVLVNSIAGYAFEIYHDKAKDRVMMIILLAMMVPFVAVLIPLYSMFADMSAINTLWALLLPSLASPFLILMFRQAARSFPYEMIEAARVDGLGEIGIFFRMFLPTMRSTFAAAVTVSFMGAWNNYLWPLVIFTRNDTKTMPLLVSFLNGMTETDYGILMLGVLLCTIPTAAVFLLLQKNFAEGITGTVKG